MQGFLLVVKLAFVVLPVWHVYDLKADLIASEHFLLARLITVLIALFLCLLVSMYRNQLSFFRVSIPSVAGLLLMQFYYQAAISYLETVNITKDVYLIALVITFIIHTCLLMMCVRVTKK